MDKSILVVLLILSCWSSFVLSQDKASKADPFEDDEPMEGSRSIGFNTKKYRTTTPRTKWRPAVPSKLLLEQEKGLNKMPADDEDPEFKYLWPDDYYDDYTFESKKSMLQHGTFESKMQNYHEAEFAEALAKLKEQNENEKITDMLN